MRLQKPLKDCLDGNERLPWFLKDTVGIEFGPTGSTVNDKDFMVKMTGADIVDKALTANAEYLILFCKDCENAYYHSKYRPCPESLGGRDLLKEVCDAAKGKDIRVLAYAVVQYDTYILREHPEYELIDDEGRRLSRVCLRSPGYTEYMKGVLDELMEYDIVGIHVDMMDLGFGPPYGCWCEHCKAEFKKQYGYDMPPKFDMDDPKWQDGQEFRYTNSVGMATGLTDYLKSKRPDLSIDFNYHGTPPFSFDVAERPVQHAKHGDFVTAETLPWVFGYNNISMAAHIMERSNPENQFQCVSSRSMMNYHEYTLRPTEDLRFEVMNILSHGGTFTLVDKAGYDGWFDPKVYERMSDVFAEARRKAPYTRGYDKKVSCAVYYSQKTRDFKYRQTAIEYNNSIAGICRMLAQSHINFSVCFDERVSLEEFSRYPLIILSNTAIVSEEEVEIFKQYVKNGGNILATGPVGICNEMGQITECSTMEELLGVSYRGIGNVSTDTYIVFPDTVSGEQEKWVKNIGTGYQLFVKGELYHFEPTTAKTFAGLYTGYRPGAAENLDNINADIWLQLMSAGIRISPAVFLNEYGKGKTLTLPCMVENAYMGTHRSPELRILMKNLIESLIPAPVVEFELPLNTEAVVTENPGDGSLLIHLTTYNPTMPALDSYFFNDRRFYANVMEESALYRGKLKINRAFGTAESLDGTPLTVSGNEISFTTDRVYEIIIVK